MGIDRFRDLSSTSANIKLSSSVSYCISCGEWQRPSFEVCTSEKQMFYGTLLLVKLASLSIYSVNLLHLL